MEYQPLIKVPPAFGGSALNPNEYRRKIALAIKNYNDMLENEPEMLVASPLTDSVQAMHLQVIQNQSK
jgi:hypothetical protein